MSEIDSPVVTYLTRRQLRILEYAYNKAEQHFWGCCINTFSSPIKPFIQPEELKEMAEDGWLIKAGGNSYFITPLGCHAIGKSFASLRSTLSHRRQWTLCLELAREGIDLAGIISEEQLERVTWSLQKENRNPKKVRNAKPQSA